MSIQNNSTCSQGETLTEATLEKVKPFTEEIAGREQPVLAAEAFWTERLSQCEGFKLDWLKPDESASASAETLNQSGDDLKVQCCEWSMNAKLHQSLVQLGGETSDGFSLALTAAIAAYLARLGNGAERTDEIAGSLAFCGATQQVEAEQSKGILAQFVPLLARLNLGQGFPEAIAQITQDLDQLGKQGCYPTSLIQNNGLTLPDLPMAVTWLETAAQGLPDQPLIESWPEAQWVNLVMMGDRLYWYYNASVLNEAAIARFQSNLICFITSLVAAPETPLAQHSLLSDAEAQQLLVEWNQTQGDYEWDCCTHHLFEQQVEQTPDDLALEFGPQQLTYRELNQRANQVAHGLMQRGVQPDDIVGVHLDRSIEMMVALLGVLKAGGCYLPMDPDYPRDRRLLMVEDAAPKVVLTQRDRQGQLDRTCELCLDDTEIWAELATENPDIAVTSSNLAYIIYTSGSTGRPKGVMIEHRALSNFAQAACTDYGIGAADRVLQFASISFDAAAEEIYPCLISGGTLVLRTPEMMDSIPQFVRSCQDYGLTVLDLPTAYWHLLVAELAEGAVQLPEAVRIVIIGGEAVNVQRVAQWQQMLWRTGGRAQLLNTYGPTEATVVATAQRLPLPDAEPTEMPAVTIGRALSNVSTYILDQNLQPLPRGAAGELCIGGAGLARGYLKQPKKTAEQFVPSPFKAEERLYRTGDLVRYRPDGEIEYLGRIDNQVKIRGFRIELGEIETLLVQHEAVEDGVVVAREDQPGQKRLVAYLLPKVAEAEGQPSSAKSPFSVSALREHLATKLPSYMVPAAFVVLDQLPLTPSGKVDRKSLPAPLAAIAPPDSASVPMTEMEQTLANIWQTLLGLEGLQPDSHFFEVGGDSLTALRMLVQLEKQLDVSFTIADLFQAPTLGALAAAIAGGAERIATSTLMPLKPSGSKIPFFFINSMTFGTMLAPYWGEDNPMYCINIFGGTEKLLALPDMTLRAMAESCVADMQVLQPHGPYFLGGYCDNSKLAFEMAQCLKAQGEDVALLAFIDATWQAEVNNLKSHWQNLLSFGPSYVCEKLKAKLKETREQRQIQRQQQESQQKAASGEGETEVGRDILLLQQYNAAAAAHAPEPFDGAIDCFLCSELRMTEVPLVEPVALDGVRIHTVTGYHHTMFTSPHVENLAQQLLAAMERAIPAEPEVEQEPAVT